MGQIIFPESIGRLYKVSTTQIALEPSVLNIGGQQYRTLSNTLLTPPMVATQLYYVYAYINAGTVTLTASTNSPTLMGSSYRHVGYLESNASSQVFIVYQGDPYAQIRQYTLASSGSAGWSQTGGSYTFMKKGNDWWVDMAVFGSFTGNTNGLIEFDSAIKFKNFGAGGYLPVLMGTDQITTGDFNAYAYPGSSRIDWFCSTSLTRATIGINLPLNEKPSFIANGLV